MSCLELRFVNFLLNEYCIVLYCIETDCLRVFCYSFVAFNLSESVSLYNVYIILGDLADVTVV